MSIRDLNKKHRVFEKILSIKSYKKKQNEEALKNIIESIDDLEKKIQILREKINIKYKINLYSIEYIDFFNKKRSELREKISELLKEKEKLFLKYRESFNEEKSILNLLKKIKSNIIKEEMREENIIIEEFVSYKSYKQ